MSTRCLAFPVLSLTRDGSVRMMEISQDTLPRIRDCLLKRVMAQDCMRTSSYVPSRGGEPKRASSSSFPTVLGQPNSDTSHSGLDECVTAEGSAGVRFDYWVGPHVCIPFTVAGSLRACSDRTDAGSVPLLLHTPGLDGGFVASLDEMSRVRGHVVLPTRSTMLRKQETEQPQHERCRIDRLDGDARRTTQFCPCEDGAGEETSSARLLGWLCVMDALRSVASPAAASTTASVFSTTATRMADAPIGWAPVMDRIYRTARRRHWGVCGMEELLQRAAAAEEDEAIPSLQLRFPYHCGGAQAYKRYLDTRDEVCCALYGDFAAHGNRVLSRYGTVVSVGVCSEAEGRANSISSVNCYVKSNSSHDGHEVSARSSKVGQTRPTRRRLHDHMGSKGRAEGRAGLSGMGDSVRPSVSLMWHACGAPAACAAPLVHGSASLVVGKVALEYNGPTAASALLERDEPRRYMNATEEVLVRRCGGSDSASSRAVALDSSLWLCQGLFGVTPGQPYRHFCSSDGCTCVTSLTGDGTTCGMGSERSGFVVAGVGYDDDTREFDLYIRDDRTGEILLADDVCY